MIRTTRARALAAACALFAAACALFAAACARGPHGDAPPLAAPAAPAAGFGSASPESQGVDARSLLDLARWIERHPAPIYSLLVSRHGKVVFELYTSSLGRDDAHYMMSVTKSVVSALVGVAIDKGLLASPTGALPDLLPASSFPTPDDRERFRQVTLKDVLGMSALDTPDPPRSHAPEAVARQRAFVAADDRLRFALAQPLLAEPGKTFLYNDIGPTIATGVLTRAVHRSALRFAEETLFRPMDFRSYEWMHEDASGTDNGGYGLRLRPIDMQKLGVLYLRRGAWDGGRQLLSERWVETTFTPWIRSSARAAEPDYGWFWWAKSYGPGWGAHAAIGWKGQRILVVPEQDVVVTMTGCLEGDEEAVFTRLVEDFLVPAVDHGGRGAPADPAITADLAATLARVRDLPRIAPGTEPRMIPSAAPKGRHHEP